MTDGRDSPGSGSNGAETGFRLGFGGKILLALVGTVVLLVGTSLWIVRHETRSQVEWLVDQRMDRAGQALSEVEQLRNETLEPLVNRFVFGIRFQAAMEEALAEDDREVLADAAAYELELAGLEGLIASFTDMEGRALLTLLDGEEVPAGRGIGPDPLVRRLLEGDEERVLGYRELDGRLYSVQVHLVYFFGRPLGTLTLGFPADAGLARHLGEVVGAEVCLAMESRCVAATPALDDPDMRARLEEAAGTEEPAMVEWDGARWAVVASPLPGGEEAGARQVLAVPLDEVLLPFDRIQRVERFVGAAALLVALLLGLGLSRSLARPVRTLVGATDRVREGDYEFQVEVESRDELGDLAEAFNGMLTELCQKERYRGLLEKVVSREVADELLRGDIRLGGETREVTTLFADVRDFSSLSEGLGSQQVITLLNEWFDEAAEVVAAEGGVVDKFLGDGLMAVFGAPLTLDDHAARGVRAALGMRDSLEELNRRREARDRPRILVGFGLATGPVVAGNMGSRDRLNYTVLGDSVNLAARLCGEAGAGEILVSPSIREAVEDAGIELDAVQEEERTLKGLARPVRPWRVRGLGSAPARTG